jgi:hypothetical protein
VEAHYRLLETQCAEASGGVKEKPLTMFADVAEDAGYRSDDDDGRGHTNPFAPVPVKKLPKEVLSLGLTTVVGKRNKPDAEDDDDDEPEEPDIVVDDEDEDDEEAEQDEGDEAPPQPPPAVTQDYAKKFVRRMALFTDLRTKVLPHRRLAWRLACATEAEMPEFWETGLHDFLLLADVARYGLGTREWTSIITSADCPYLPSAASEKPAAVQWLTNAVANETLLISRLEYLRALVLNPRTVEQLTGRVGYQTYMAHPKGKKDNALPLKALVLQPELPVEGL